MAFPKTVCDIVTSKSIYIDGKKIAGVLGCHVNMDIDGDLRTVVNLRLAIKRGSLKITRFNNKKGQRVEFSTCNEAFK